MSQPDPTHAYGSRNYPLVDILLDGEIYFITVLTDGLLERFVAGLSYEVARINAGWLAIGIKAITGRHPICAYPPTREEFNARQASTNLPLSQSTDLPIPEPA